MLRAMRNIAVAGAVLAGGTMYAAQRFEQDPTIILKPNTNFPPEKEMLSSVATIVCDASVAVENCNETTMQGEISSGTRRFALLKDISPDIVKAAEASEDRTFRENPGVNGSAIIRAFLVNGWDSLKQGQIVASQGASGITQQDTRLRFDLPHASSLAEKKYEGELALGLEESLETPCAQTLGFAVQNKYPADQYKLIRGCVKDEVMVDYLNRIYFGEDAYGVETSTERRFGVSAKDVTPSQAIMTIATIKSPSATDMVSDTAAGVAKEENKLHARYDVIVEDEKQAGYITAKQAKDLHDAYADTLAHSLPYTAQGGINTAPAKKIAAEHVTVQAMQQAADALGLKSIQDLSGKGYKIFMTIDPTYEAAAANAIRVADANKQGYQAAMAAIAKDGRVIALVGGLDRSVSKVNLATGVQGGGSGHNAGSSNKDTIAVAAFENGHTATDMIHIGVGCPGTNGKVGCVTLAGADNGKTYTIKTGDECKEITGHAAPCDMTLSQASEASSNVAYGVVLGEIGTAPAYGAVRVYDINHEFGGDIQGPPVASVVVGSGEVSPYGQATVRAGLFLNQGHPIQPYLVDKIYDAKGNLVWQHTPTAPGSSDVKPADAVNVQQMMRAPVEGVHGTAYGAFNTQYFKPNTVSLKTGTAGMPKDSSKNSDLWSNSTSCDLKYDGIAASFWIGHVAGVGPLPSNISSRDAARLDAAFLQGAGSATGCQLSTTVEG